MGRVWAGERMGAGMERLLVRLEGEGRTSESGRGRMNMLSGREVWECDLAGCSMQTTWESSRVYHSESASISPSSESEEDSSEESLSRKEEQ